MKVFIVDYVHTWTELKYFFYELLVWAYGNNLHYIDKIMLDNFNAKVGIFATTIHKFSIHDETTAND